MDGLLFNRCRLRRRPVAGIIFASEEPRKSVDQLDHSRIKRGRFAFLGCAGARAMIIRLPFQARKSIAES
jgi:hypothetical protein